MIKNVIMLTSIPIQKQILVLVISLLIISIGIKTYYNLNTYTKPETKAEL